MKPDFFARRALLILCVVFFLVPFALRGARMSLERMENNVKDWLPDSFDETRELTWFARHFVGEQSFVLITWEGCSDKDESYRLFVEKLRGEVLPANEQPIEVNHALASGSEESSPEQEEEARRRELIRARQLGDQLGLFATGDYHQNWGGLEEKWLRGEDQSWYYVTPNGELYRWHGRSNILGALGRLLTRTMARDRSLSGTLVATLGRPPSRERRNEFHNDPRRLTARVLRSVTTGPDVLAELSQPGGSMWPVGMDYSEEERARIARRRSLDRLKGTLFGPEPYDDFEWTAADLRRVVYSSTLEQLPAGWEARVDAFGQSLIENRYGGDRTALMAASLLDKEAHWNALFEQLGTEPPGLQTCIMVTLSPAGTEDLRRVIGRGLLGKPRGKLVDLAVDSGVRAPAKPPMMPLAAHLPSTGKELRMGGPPVDNVAIDEEGQITLVRLVGFSVLIGLGLGYVCFRRVTVTMMIFLVGGISAVTSLSIVWWSGSSVDAILMSMPSLVYVLGLSGAVHIVNYYREAVKHDGLAGAPGRALAHGFIPCTLAAFTTSLGLLSLCQSNIFPIRKFGFFSALGVMATLTLLFTYLPSALQLWPPHYGSRPRADGRPSLRQRIHAFWQTVGDWVVDHHWWVVAGAGVVLVSVGMGLTKLNTSIQLLKLFDQDAKIIRDYYWLEANVGKLVPMELIVSVGKQFQYPTLEQRKSGQSTAVAPGEEKYQYSFLERVELVSHVQEAVENVFGEQGQDIVGRALSAATFTPPVLDPLDRQRLTVNSFLELNRDRLLQESYLAVDDDGSELWRISVRLGALNDVDYGQFVSQLKRVVEPVLKAYQYRDVILRAIAKEDTGPDDASNAWDNTKIAILGAADPRAPLAVVEGETPERVAASTTPGASPTGRLAAQTDDMLGVDRVFAKVLGDLLRAKKFDGRRRGRTPKQLLVWHDPQARPLGENAQSEQWGAELAQYDCVVLMSDHPDYHLDFIRQHARQLIDAREHTFDPIGGKTAKESSQAIAVTYTGVVPIVYKAQRTLLHSLIDSIWWAFVMIATVMIFLLRTKRTQLFNLPAGLVSMIPNLFPVILIFGAMGHMGVLVDIGTMMTASVAMGVAVDDTIHFLTWFRRGIREGLDRAAAIKKAYGHVALAMTQTTLIGGLGLSVFALSTFTPTQRFGTMMLTLLFAALIGDLIVLPALLAGPLGRYFCPKVTPDPAGTGPREAAANIAPALALDAEPSGPVGSGDGRPPEPKHRSAREGRSPMSTQVRRDTSH